MMEGQQSIWTMVPATKVPSGAEYDWLVANGFKNVYREKPAEPGIYLCVDINYIYLVKPIRYNNPGWTVTWAGDWRVGWWKPAAGDSSKLRSR